MSKSIALFSFIYKDTCLIFSSFVQLGGAIHKQQSNIYILRHSVGGDQPVRAVAHLRQRDHTGL